VVIAKEMKLKKSKADMMCVVEDRGMIITPAWSVFLIRPPRERGDEYKISCYDPFYNIISVLKECCLMRWYPPSNGMKLPFMPWELPFMPSCSIVEGPNRISWLTNLPFLLYIYLQYINI